MIHTCPLCGESCECPQNDIGECWHRCEANLAARRRAFESFYGITMRT